MFVPKNFIHLKYFLNQTFESILKRKLVHVPPVFITKKKEVFGAVIYDESGLRNDEMVLAFFTTTMDSSKKDFCMEYPQRPVSGTWHIEYPLLAYKNYTPDNKEICIVNFA